MWKRPVGSTAPRLTQALTVDEGRGYRSHFADPSAVRTGEALQKPAAFLASSPTSAPHLKEDICSRMVPYRLAPRTDMPGGSTRLPLDASPARQPGRSVTPRHHGNFGPSHHPFVPMSRKKISTTIYVTPEQSERLRLLHERTKVPVAVYIREGIDLVLRQYDHLLPGQLPLAPEPSPVPPSVEPRAASRSERSERAERVAAGASETLTPDRAAGAASKA
jgi:Ribbon-helix-helix domain